ncbi:MAG: insulinase family protein [Gemmatimonadota bacterium]|nr:insulinase family protein [Gemmatimonadota bacterium]MDH5758492.1 insulinase family protein [Gemmatimonadota bacterium]
MPCLAGPRRPARAGRSTLLFLIALASVGHPEASSAMQEHRSVVQTDTVLDNGLRVTVLENHDVPLVSVLVAVRAGAFTQPPGEEGIAHLYEHLLFRSFGGDPSDFAQEAGKLNASYNGTTGPDVVTYYLILPSEETEGAVKLLARLITQARFRGRDLERELPVVLDELARDASDPTARLERQISRMLWGPDWHRFDIGGDSTSLRSVSVERLQEHFDRLYVPDNSVLLVTGDAYPREVFEWAADRFEKWDPGENDATGGLSTPLSPLAGTRAVLVPENVLETTIQVHIRAPGGSGDIATLRGLEALVEVLDEPSGTFQTALVTNGPFQSLDVNYRIRWESGTIVFAGTATLDRTQDAVSRLMTALQQIDLALDRPENDTGTGEGGTLEETISVTSKRWNLDLALTTERTALLAGHMATLWGKGGGTYLYDESPFDTHRTEQELAAIAREYIHGEAKVIGILAPPTVIERFQETMRGGSR